VYGLTQWVFNHDSATALAHLDTVLMADPGYQLGLSWCAQVWEQLGNYDSAITCFERVRAYHPESPTPYLRLAGMYDDQMRTDDAIREYKLAAELFPEQTVTFRQLANLYTRKRDFKSAREWAERSREASGDDPYELFSYYRLMSNLANWEGKFRSGGDYLHQSLESAYRTGDSTYISTALRSLHGYFSRHDEDDSARYYLDESRDWTTRNFLGGFDYALTAVGDEPGRCDEMRAVVDESIREFKARVPEGIWSVGDLVSEIYDAVCAADTATMIDVYTQLAEMRQLGGQEGNRRQVGYLKVLTGEYAEGKAILEGFVQGRMAPTSALQYCRVIHMLGVACDELGQKEEAIGYFEELLSYWDNADIETDDIRDTRERLAALRG